MLTLFIVFVSVGHFRDVSAKSLVSSADLVSEADFGKPIWRHTDGRTFEDASVDYFNDQQKFLDVRIEEFNLGRVDTANDKAAAGDGDETQQSLVLVETKRRRQRGKRYIQRAPLTPYCLFKICKMGRKRHFP